MEFEWDERKNEKNKEKHNIGFEDILDFFDNETYSFVDNRFDYREIRKINIGKIKNGLILTVITTKRKETIRIISARVSNKKERILYFNNTGF